MQTIGVLACFYNPVKGCGHEQEHRGDEKESQSGNLNDPGCWRKCLEAQLEKGAKLKPEQHLRAENQRSRFIEGIFDFVAEFSHSVRIKGLISAKSWSPARGAMG